MANPILDMVLRAQPTEEEKFSMVSPAQLQKNVDTVARGEVPAGVDMQSILSLAVSQATQPMASTAIEESIVSRSLNSMAATQVAAATAYEEQRRALAATAAAEKDTVATGLAVDRITYQQSMTAGDKLQTLLDEQIATDTDLRTQVRGVSSELKTNFEAAEAARGLGIVDLVTDPIDYLKTKIAGGAAERKLDLNIAELNAIDATRAIQANTFVSSVGALEKQATLRLSINENAYMADLDAKAIFKTASIEGAVTTANLEGLIQRGQIDVQAASVATSALNAARAKGELTAQRTSQLLQAAQIETTNRNLKRLEAEAAKNEAVTATLDMKVQEWERVTGDDFGGSFAVALTLKESGNMTDSQATAMTLFLSNGSLGAATILNSTQPWQDAMALIQSGNTSEIPDEMLQIINTVETWQSTGIPKLAPEFYSLSPEEQLAVRNQRLGAILQETQTNADPLFVNHIANLYSPKALFAGDLTSFQDFPAPAAMAEMKTWDLDTTSLDAFIQDAVALGGRSNLPISELANGMAYIMKMHLDGVTKNTGLPLTGLGSTILGDKVFATKDSTNPGNWVEQLEKARTRYRRSAAGNNTFSTIN